MHAYVDCSNGVTTTALLHVFLQLSNNTNIRKFKIALGKKEKKHRTFSEVKKIISRSKFDSKTKLLAKKIFLNLAKAEAKVHKEKISTVKFHEVGRRSNIYRVLLLCSLLTHLKIKKFYCSKINVGSGKVKTSHGILSIPTPATKELLRGFKTFSKGKGELVTPTSAAILKVFCKQLPIHSPNHSHQN